jgi:hypothetical protein
MRKRRKRRGAVGGALKFMAENAVGIGVEWARDCCKEQPATFVSQDVQADSFFCSALVPLQLVVDDKIAKMEAAAETDMDEHAAGRPATSKLRMLSEVEEFLAQVCGAATHALAQFMVGAAARPNSSVHQAGHRPSGGWCLLDSAVPLVIPCSSSTGSAELQHAICLAYGTAFWPSRP